MTRALLLEKKIEMLSALSSTSSKPNVNYFEGIKSI